jgi:hypothetical protein
MKLQELAAPKVSKQITRVFESYFGSGISFDKLTGSQATTMLHKVRGLLGEHRETAARYQSERDPSYLKLVMMEQALTTRVRETKPDTPQRAAVARDIAVRNIADPGLERAVNKGARGMGLTPDEGRTVANKILQTEQRLRRAYQFLRESEVQQAQVVLAAQDMVDQMQSMIEDTTSMQFKELPALVDSIRNQVGIDQATQFNTDVSGALTGLVQNLQGAKQQLETALGVVTGQTPTPLPGVDMAPDAMAGMAAGEVPGGAPPMGADLEAGGMGAEPAAEMPPEAPAPAAALGRKRR